MKSSEYSFAKAVNRPLRKETCCTTVMAAIELTVFGDKHVNPGDP
jgi:hypothetical protein